MSGFEVVSRKDVPARGWTPSGAYGQAFAALLEIQGDGALKVAVADPKRGRHMHKRLQEIADKEHIGKTVAYSRSKDGKEFFFWMEKSEAK